MDDGRFPFSVSLRKRCIDAGLRRVLKARSSTSAFASPFPQRDHSRSDGDPRTFLHVAFVARDQRGRWRSSTGSSYANKLVPVQCFYHISIPLTSGDVRRVLSARCERDAASFSPASSLANEVSESMSSIGLTRRYDEKC